MSVTKSTILPSTQCLHPRSKTFYDAYSQKMRTIHFPCGKCWNCIHSFRESWRIRLFESMLASRSTSVGGFIYDTLTLSNDAMPTFSAYDYFSGEAVYPAQALRDDKLLRIIDHYGGRIPYLPKSTVSRWLKIGREKYKYAYGRRCNLRFFGVLEYGPLWSRPHIHIAVFGVSLADWIKFWAKPWRQQMGFTKTKFINLRSLGMDSQEHCSRISTYISKYILKGNFESPLIKWGLIPPVYRICSHGIGIELLENDFQHRFDWLSSDILFHIGNRVSSDSCRNSRLFQETMEYCQKFAHLTPKQVDSLKTYSLNGYKFALPRYYRDKLLCTHNKGLAGCAIKVSLLEDACDHCFEEILQYASDCGFFPNKNGDGLRHLLEHDLRAFNFAYCQYSAHKKHEALRAASWHRLSSLNSYNRLRSKQNTGDLGLLL